MMTWALHHAIINQFFSKNLLSSLKGNSLLLWTPDGMCLQTCGKKATESHGALLERVNRYIVTLCSDACSVVTFVRTKNVRTCQVDAVLPFFCLSDKGEKVFT